MSYNKTYTNFDNVFGSEPENILTKYFENIDKTKPVLDIGAGQGRNSIFLAEKGYNVDAIDTSIIAVETLSEIKHQRELNINSLYTSYNNFIPVHDCYAGILVFGLIQILSLNEIANLINKINNWACPGALILITAFGTKDFGFEKYSKIWKHEKDNSFTDGKNNYRTFLKENEILNLFSAYKVIHHHEGWGKEHHHGDGIMEKHYIIEAVFEKKK